MWDCVSVDCDSPPLPSPRRCFLTCYLHLLFHLLPSLALCATLPLPLFPSLSFSCRYLPSPSHRAFACFSPLLPSVSSPFLAYQCLISPFPLMLFAIFFQND
eukprot:NODE_8371_length_402_cov_2.453258_g7895_i0.p3 GENE.NODE_8371_length_402_cov_2.453258_g7895_i0~~NODE_8371_length_402_cov_2.453258_g7895_i0.p3  ORF type:complete len:102 (-),score=2.56 NODE_8371_length_402_cov_2.453258_g7895_i0:5-310(-)